MRLTPWVRGIGTLCLLASTVATAPGQVGGKRVLLLVANRDNLINFDPALKLRLEWQHAAEVTVEQADTFDTFGLDELALEHDLVLISESLGSTAVLENNVFKLQDTPVPIISFEAYMWEDAFWSDVPQFDAFGNTGRTDLIGAAEAAGLEEPQTEFYITAEGAQSPLGAGFPEGPLTIHTQPYSVNFGTPSEDATVIATADAAGQFPSHFVYETNDRLVDGSQAPAPRVALFVGQLADPNANFAPMPEIFNDNALALIDAAFELALGPMPTPGDVNLDGEVNLEDFGPIRDEFLSTGMTRADTNHDGVVDFADFGLWKLNAQALAGARAAVPEPTSLGLALGVFGLLAAVRYSRPRRAFAVRGVAVILLAAMAGSAIADEVSWIRTAADGPSNWNEDTNWVSVDGQNYVPEAEFGDTPVIANGGTAFLDEPAHSNDDPFNMVIVGRDDQAGGLEIRSGGELKTDSLTVGGAETSALTLSGDSTLTVSGDASATRITRISGPDVDFSVSGSYTVGGSFQPVITAPTHSAVEVGGTANVSGTLRPEFDGVAPQLGDSWDLIDADSVAGTFLVDTSLAPPLDPGIIYASRIDETAGDVSLLVTNTLDLVVNRRTGAASIRNVVGDAIELDSYTISSASGRLDPSDGAWLSLADSGGAGAGWTEGASDAQMIAESKAGEPSSIAVGSPVNLGSPLVPANFADEDLLFRFSNGGVSMAGLVTYEGVPLNLILNVDPETGHAEIINQATIPIEFDGYAVTSPSGALQTADGQWNSLNDSGAGGEGWQEANPSATALAELNPIATTTLSPNESVDLGTAFDTSKPQDLAFRFFLAGGSPDLREGFVAYGLEATDPLDCNGDGVVTADDLSCVCATGMKETLLAQLGLVDGDLNASGSVDFPDFLALSANFGQAVTAYNQGDIDCNGMVEFADFLVLSANYGQSAGAASAVPEPSGVTLLMLGAFLIVRGQPRQHRLAVHPGRSLSRPNLA